MILLFESDAWNSNKRLIAVCTSKKTAIKLANKHSDYKLSSDNVRNLEDILQTQGRETNYDLQVVYTNELLD